MAFGSTGAATAPAAVAGADARPIQSPATRARAAAIVRNLRCMVMSILPPLSGLAKRFGQAVLLRAGRTSCSSELDAGADARSLDLDSLHPVLFAHESSSICPAAA